MKKKFNAYLPLLAGVLLIVAALMVFLPGVNVTTTLLGRDHVDTYTGLQAVFGQKEDPALKFNLGAFLGWVLLLGAGALCLVGTLNRKLGMLVLVAAGVAVAGAVLVFLEAVFFKDVNANALAGLLDSKFSIAAGPIIGGILGILGALAAGYAGVRALMSKK